MFRSITSLNLKDVCIFSAYLAIEVVSVSQSTTFKSRPLIISCIEKECCISSIIGLRTTVSPTVRIEASNTLKLVSTSSITLGCVTNHTRSESSG